MKKQLSTNNSQKAFEEACAQRGYNPIEILPDVSRLPEWLQKYTHSAIKRVVIAEAINDGRIRKPGKETVYFPLWDLTDNTSGFGFSGTYSDVWGTHTFVGSRLEFFSREDSDFFGKNFMDLHKDVLTINQ
ncbi:MAG TPA: hypothetical protein VGM41_08280 [Chitinophagaceae bacterium]|jgi:hypothetical protein